MGQTGSGKTTLARYLLKFRKFVVVLDYKGRINWPEYEVHTSVRSLMNAEHSRLLYRPNYAESVSEDKQDEVWQWIYQRQNCTAYIDELTSIAKGDAVYPFHYGACLVRGRELNIEVWSGTQRPLKIPQVTLSESEHVYCFSLILPQDRKKIVDATGMSYDEIAGLDKREFLYSRQGSGVYGPFSLELPDRGTVPSR